MITTLLYWLYFFLRYRIQHRSLQCSNGLETLQVRIIISSSSLPWFFFFFPSLVCLALFRFYKLFFLWMAISNKPKVSLNELEVKMATFINYPEIILCHAENLISSSGLPCCQNVAIQYKIRNILNVAHVLIFWAQWHDIMLHKVSVSISQGESE